MPVSNRVYSDLLETLYATTFDLSQWPPFIAGLCDATSSTVGFLMRNDSSRGRQVLASGGVELPPEFERGYFTADPVREAFMRQPRTGIIEVEDFLPRHFLVQTAYYPVMAAFGVTYGTCIVPRLSTRRFDLIAIWRDDDRVRLEPDSSELLQLLYPHTQTAIRIHEALGTTQQRALSAEALLDKNTTPSMVLSPSGKLLYCNQAARLMLAKGDSFVEKKAHITPLRNEQQSEFLRLVTEASRIDGAGGSIAIECLGGRPPLQVVVSPVRGYCPSRSRSVLVLASNPAVNPNFPDVLLRQLYGFTPAETDVANGFLTGLSPEAIAVARGVSIGTVRSQIKSLLAKTNTQRLIDLVRLLYSIPRTLEDTDS
jgi:DNA-binding CsgD family transcriptional regulator